MNRQSDRPSWARIIPNPSASQLANSSEMWPALPVKRNFEEERFLEAEARKEDERELYEEEVSELIRQFMLLGASRVHPKFGDREIANVEKKMASLIIEVNRLRVILNQKSRSKPPAQLKENEANSRTETGPGVSLKKNPAQLCTSERVEKIEKLDAPRRVEKWVMESGGEEHFLSIGQAEALGNEQVGWFCYRD